ncbi:MAG: hypothetical protein BGO01_18785 [Armatimonadetes bacterium 55-13]|nr:hypothetical protein [Armatimonadota bacterium]ODU54112.1 MAG: hypothetical protein ABT09_00215 [bacterium SCN 57-13]OJU64173.1 MAG: hypothetical protein BGO01_18785 [Armatimonadetes bacterium 55-13]
MTALQALGLLRLLSASSGAVKILDQSPFFAALHRTAHETLVMALWRMFDSDPKTAGILGVCTHAKKSPQECTWLFSATGKAEFPNGNQEVAARSDKWITWRENLPFTKQLGFLRNQYVGHR